MLKSGNLNYEGLCIYVLHKSGRRVLGYDRELIIASLLMLVLIWMSQLSIMAKRVLGVE